MKLLKVLNGTLLVSVIIATFIVSMMLNIVLHELGHYGVAKYYGLEPIMNFSPNSSTSIKAYIFKFGPIASTSYNNGATTQQNFMVVAMGPYVHLLLSIIFLIGLIHFKDNRFKFLMLTAFVVSACLFILNLVPFKGTDGYQLFQLLKWIN